MATVVLVHGTAAGWPVYEVDTAHQITPDPNPNADVLVRILRDHFR